jgi:hypothetical protein
MILLTPLPTYRKPPAPIITLPCITSKPAAYHTMRDLLFSILILLSILELAFTAYMWYSITRCIFSSIHVWTITASKSIGGVKVVTQTIFAGLVDSAIVLGIFVVLASTAAMAFGHRDGGGRGWGVRPMVFG